MTIFRLSGSTSLIPNNLIFYKEENENVAVVATKGGVLIGQNQKIKIESEIISLIKLPKYRLAIVRRGFKASDWLVHSGAPKRLGQQEVGTNKIAIGTLKPHLSAKKVFLYQLTRPINQNTASHIDTWDAPNDDRFGKKGFHINMKHIYGSHYYN